MAARFLKASCNGRHEPSPSIGSGHCLLLVALPHFLQFPNGFAYQRVASLGADHAIDDSGTVAAASDGPPGGQVGRAAGGKLDDQGLNRGAGGLDPDPVIGVKFEGIGRHGHVAKPQQV